MIWEFIPLGEKSTFDDYKAANFTLPGSLRRRNLKPDLSPKISVGSHVKQTLGLRWSLLVEKGKRYWEDGVLPALEGRSPFPTPQWIERDLVGDDTLDTGLAWKDEPEENLPDHWKDVFELIPEGNKADRNDDTTLVSLDHNGASTNIRGDTGVPPTLAQYYTYILSQACAIITTVAYSPSSLLADYGIKPQDIPTRLPAVHRASDVLWLVWQSYQPHPSKFRYFAVERTVNTVTEPLMDEIFQARRGTVDVPWSKRLTFDLSSEEGKALLASPNGVAVVWILMNRAEVLGRRWVRVSIFNPGGSMRCMIWELVPVWERGVFGEVEGGREGGVGGVAEESYSA
ncbi:MAG: hypothetical protein L6R42_009855 [Xanthoria sp. 1 TBL-2021]|nr:MAG: hypothetical protein L6R42_009855 [Xanthoria sp. 1 TBL-2021]